MKQILYQVDAFTDELFKGNPAGVCPLAEWLSDDLMQNIALENNLAETAFFIRSATESRIRWFTPVVEVDLCGHATLATAHVIFTEIDPEASEIQFDSRSGILRVQRDSDKLTLDFPADRITPAAAPGELLKAFPEPAIEVYRGRDDYMLVFATEDIVRKMKPDLGIIEKCSDRGVIVTARGVKTDFVSRFFGPAAGVPEDPVTGSAHTTLAPYWGKILGKDVLTAYQASRRGGHLECRLSGERVFISGSAVTYLKGEIYLPD
jgi:PhzF family phenazine biosynthesis protein